MNNDNIVIIGFIDYGNNPDAFTAVINDGNNTNAIICIGNIVIAIFNNDNNTNAFIAVINNDNNANDIIINDNIVIIIRIWNNDNNANAFINKYTRWGPLAAPYFQGGGIWIYPKFRTWGEIYDFATPSSK